MELMTLHQLSLMDTAASQMKFPFPRLPRKMTNGLANFDGPSDIQVGFRRDVKFSIRRSTNNANKPL